MFLKNLRDEIDATLARDPAARSRLEVALCYPGFHALVFHRLAHWLWRRGWFLAGRFVSYLGRMQTGIEIHPGAKIGRRLFIDHGIGVVIGETAEVGDDCTIYQGVTLGGTRLTRGAKRHPTIGNGVIVSAHAQVLGPFRVGDGARIGPLALVQAEVPDGARMVGMRARPLGPRLTEPGAEPVFQPYAIGEDIPDPVARALNGLLDEVTNLRARVAELERTGGREAAPAVDLTEPSHGNGADDAERLS
jgi:serine O-acetyltransferase